MSKYTLHKIPANDAFTTNVSHLEELAPEFARISKVLGDSKSNAGAVGIFGGAKDISPVIYGAPSDANNWMNTYRHSEREGMRGALEELRKKYSEESNFPNYHIQHKNPLENAKAFTKNAHEYQSTLEKLKHIVNIWSEWPPCINQENKEGGSCRDFLNKSMPTGSVYAYTAGIKGFDDPTQSNARKNLIETWENHKKQKPQQTPIFSLQQLGGFGGFNQPLMQFGSSPQYMTDSQIESELPELSNRKMDEERPAYSQQTPIFSLQQDQPPFYLQQPGGFSQPLMQFGSSPQYMTNSKLFSSQSQRSSKMNEEGGSLLSYNSLVSNYIDTKEREAREEMEEAQKQANRYEAERNLYQLPHPTRTEYGYSQPALFNKMDIESPSHSQPVSPRNWFSQGNSNYNNQSQSQSGLKPFLNQYQQNSSNNFGNSFFRKPN